MAKNESKSNKIPKLSDVIESTISNIQEITDAAKVIVGSIEDLAKLIPDGFDERVKKIQTNLLMGIESVDELIKVFADIDNGIKLDLKSLLTMRFKINILNQYMQMFMQILETVAHYANHGKFVDEQFNSFKDSVFTGLEKQIDLINSLELSTITMKMLMARLFVIEFKQLTEFLIKTLNSIKVDKFNKDVVENTRDVIENMDASMVALTNVSIIKLLENYKKIQLIRDNIQILLDMQIALFDKINKRRLDGIKNRLASLNEITDILVEILNKLKDIRGGKNVQKHIDICVDTIVELVNGFEKINERISKVDLTNINISPLLEVIDTVLAIEKKIIFISLLSAPFAAAAILFMAGITVGMAAILLTIHVIMKMTNPVLLRLARMSMRNLYKTILYIGFVVASTILIIMLITISALYIIENIEVILLSIGVIGIVVLAFAALGWVVGFAATGIVMFSAGMIALGIALVAIVGITMLLKAVGKIKFTEQESEKIKENVKNILDTATSVIHSIFSSFNEDLGPSKGNGLVLHILSWIGGDMFVNAIKLIMASSILVFTIMATGLVYLTAITLNTLQGNSITEMLNNKTKIVSNVRDILSTAKDVIHAIFDSMDSPISDGGDGILLWAAGFVLGDTFTNTFKLILSCISLTFTVIATALVKLTSSVLNSISEIKFSRAAIQTNTQAIMGAARDVIASVNSPMDEISAPKKSISRRVVEALVPSSLMNTVDAVMAIGSLGPTMIAVGAVGFMARQLDSIQKLSVDRGSIKNKSAEIISAGNDIIKLINKSKELKGVDIDDVVEWSNAVQSVAKAVNELGKGVDINKHTKATENMVKFVDKVQKIELTKLQTAHNLFKEMKEFSKSISGNFEGLADALNEKIAPLLEDLKQLMDKIPDAVDRSATTISGSVYNSSAIASGTATPSSIQSQIMAENPSMSKEAVSKMVDQRMEQQAQTVGKGIEMKLEELIDVLQNYANPIPVRMS